MGSPTAPLELILMIMESQIQGRCGRLYNAFKGDIYCFNVQSTAGYVPFSF